MTADLADALDCIYTARVPAAWLKKSWISPSMGIWFGSLCNRAGELNSWLTNGRPKSFWLTGFFNAQGFLTAVQQEVTRRHSAQSWSLDDVEVKTDITNKEKEDVDRDE